MTLKQSQILACVMIALAFIAVCARLLWDHNQPTVYRSVRQDRICACLVDGEYPTKSQCGQVNLDSGTYELVHIRSCEDE